MRYHGRFLPGLLAFSFLAVGTALSSCGSKGGNSLDGQLGGSSGSGSSGGSGFSSGGSSSSGGGGPSSSGAIFGGGDASTIIALDSGCATGMAQAKRQPVYLEFVLDAS